MKLPDIEHVPPRTVRFWALFDTGVLALALPFTAPLFLRGLYWLNGMLGRTAAVPALDPLAMFFVNLSGLMVLVWIVARLLHPSGTMALIDTIGRCAVSLLIAYYIVAEDLIPILWLFIGTEMAGAIAQLRAMLPRTADA